MAAELKGNFQAEAELFAEAKGIFDVVVDGELIFSKYEAGRFPEANEITAVINKTEPP